VSAATATALEFEPTAEDRAFVAQLRGGDAAAFRALVDRFHPSMLRLARATERRTSCRRPGPR
jgi:hypothetical protein